MLWAATAVGCAAMGRYVDACGGRWALQPKHVPAPDGPALEPLRLIQTLDRHGVD